MLVNDLFTNFLLGKRALQKTFCVVFVQKKLHNLPGKIHYTDGIDNSFGNLHETDHRAVNRTVCPGSD